MKHEAAERALSRAKEIRALMGDMLEDLKELRKDESVPAPQRHLIMKQVCSYFSDRNSEITKLADQFLEEEVEIQTYDKIPGITLEAEDGSSMYVAGMVYGVKPSHKVEIVNKEDDAAWNALVMALAKAGMAKVIQKRLTASFFLGAEGHKLLEICAGLVNCTTEETWSITKPKEPKDLRHVSSKK